MIPAGAFSQSTVTPVPAATGSKVVLSRIVPGELGIVGLEVDLFDDPPVRVQLREAPLEAVGVF